MLGHIHTEIIDELVKSIINNIPKEVYTKSIINSEKKRILSKYEKLEKIERFIFLQNSADYYNAKSKSFCQEFFFSFLIQDLLRICIITKETENSLIKHFRENINLVLDLIKNKQLIIYISGNNWDIEINENQILDIINNKIPFNSFIEEYYFNDVPTHTKEYLEKPDGISIKEINNFSLPNYFSGFFSSYFDFDKLWETISSNLLKFNSSIASNYLKIKDGTYQIVFNDKIIANYDKPFSTALKLLNSIFLNIIELKNADDFNKYVDEFLFKHSNLFLLKDIAQNIDVNSVENKMFQNEILPIIREFEEQEGIKIIIEEKTEIYEFMQQVYTPLRRMLMDAKLKDYITLDQMPLGNFDLMELEILSKKDNDLKESFREYLILNYRNAIQDNFLLPLDPQIFNKFKPRDQKLQENISITQIKNLCNLLIENNFIAADTKESAFQKLFNQDPIQENEMIVWLPIGKNKHPNKLALCTLIIMLLDRNLHKIKTPFLFEFIPKYFKHAKGVFNKFDYSNIPTETKVYEGYSILKKIVDSL